MLTIHQVDDFLKRLDRLNPDQKPIFGKMNVNQMICHCTDQIRVAVGTIRAQEYGKIDPREIIYLSKTGQTVPTPKGLGQVEGDGTKPTNFSNDILILKQHILDFSKLSYDTPLYPHPYFGEISNETWAKLVIHHLNHHLKQFNV